MGGKKMTETVNVLVRLDNDLVKFISDYVLDDNEDLCEFVADCVEEKIQNLIDDHCFTLEEFVSVLASIFPVVESEDNHGN